MFYVTYAFQVTCNFKQNHWIIFTLKDTDNVYDVYCYCFDNTAKPQIWKSHSQNNQHTNTAKTQRGKRVYYYKTNFKKETTNI